MHLAAPALAIVAMTVLVLSLTPAPAAAAGPPDDGADLPRPSPSQLEWQDYEVGQFIHLDITIFAPKWDFQKMADYPSPDVFDPEKLDTDQWLQVAKAIGAKYAVLTAKHCSGFCLWPTDVYPYSVKQSKWRGGKGDICADFIRSCHKYGIKPGFYYSTVWNSYLKVAGGRVKSGDPAEQARYKDICERQLTELWTRYGKLAEIWFDGGSLPPDQGGPDIGPLVRKYQPQAVVFQSPYASIRWVGNEDGFAPYPCWSTNATRDAAGAGDPDGKFWCPAECDTTLRGHEWFWGAGQEDLIKPLATLVDIYYRSVGHNANLILNSTPDPSGLIPAADMARYREFGAEIRRLFGHPVGETSGVGNIVTLDFGKPTRIDQAVIMEDLAQGERVRAYVLRALVDGWWQTVAEGTCVGHKKIDRFEPVTAEKLRVRVTAAAATPHLRRLAAYDIGG